MAEAFDIGSGWMDVDKNSELDLTAICGDGLTKVIDQLGQLNLALAQGAAKNNIRWVSVEEFAQILNEPNAVAYIKRLLNPNLPARTQREYINPDDLIKAGGKIKIRYSEIPIKGVSYPRFIEKPLEESRRKKIIPKDPSPVPLRNEDDRKSVPTPVNP